MRIVLKMLLNCLKRKQKKFDQYGLKIIEKKENSIILSCFGMTRPKNGKVKLTDSNGNIIEDNIPRGKVDAYIKKYEDAAQKKYKNLPKEEAVKKYLDDVLDTKRVLKLTQDYLDLRRKYLKLSKKELYAIWDDVNVIRRETLSNKELYNLYNKYINKYLRKSKKGNKLKSKLEGRNFAEFEIKRFDENGKLLERNFELSHSGADKIDDAFLDPVIDSNFLRNVEDFEGIKRGNDSEVRFIYNFIKKHFPKEGTFEITTKNIFIACDSCKRELLVLQDLLKGRGKINVVSVDQIKGTKDLKQYLKLK